MHPQAWSFLQSQRQQVNPKSIIDIGGRNVNGTPRDLFPGAEYTALDWIEGPGVDIVANAATWIPERTWTAGVCTEMFEHVQHDWHVPILKALKLAVEPGGVMLLTCATDPRPMHAADGHAMLPGEFYGNVPVGQLLAAFAEAGWTVEFQIYQRDPGDLYIRARNV